MSHLILQSGNKNESFILQRYLWHLQQMIKIKEKNNFCILLEQRHFTPAMHFPLQISFIKRNVSISCCQGSSYFPATPKTETYFMEVSEIRCLFVWKFFQPSGSFTGSLFENQPASSKNLKGNKGILLPIALHEFNSIRNFFIQLIHWEYFFLIH